MTSLSRLIAAAALVTTTALTPGLAAAGDHRDGRDQDDRQEARGRDDRRGEWDRDRGDRHDRWDRDERRAAWGHDPGRYAPPPAWARQEDARWNGRGWVRAGWRPDERGERYERARAIRFELAALERDRADFAVQLWWNPRALEVADARYFARCAELERELQQLTWYASR